MQAAGGQTKSGKPRVSLHYGQSESYTEIIYQRLWKLLKRHVLESGVQKAH